MIDYKSVYKVGGCIPQPKDKRDWKFKKYVKPLRAMQLPDNYESDIPNDFVFDQGNSSECCACAYSMVRMIQEHEQSGLDEPFSPSFTYANRKIGDYEGEGMRGTTMVWVNKSSVVLNNFGRCQRQQPFFWS